MFAGAEARSHDGVVDRFADQEFLRALSGLVIIVDDVIVGGLEAVEFLDLAADRERGEQHVVLGFDARRFFLAGIEHVEGIAGLRLALEIDVVGIDADQFVDDRARDLIAQRGLVDALVEAGAFAVVIVVVVAGIGDLRVDARHVDRDVFSHIRQRHDRLDGAFVGDNHADRLLPLAAENLREKNAQSQALFKAIVAAARSENGGDRLDLFRRRSEIAQDGRNVVALLDRDRTLAPGIAAGRLVRGFRKQRDVFRDDAGLETAIGIGRGIGGRIGELAGLGDGDGERFAAIAAGPIRGFADADERRRRPASRLRSSCA